jgi:hypothetical protein
MTINCLSPVTREGMQILVLEAWWWQVQDFCGPSSIVELSSNFEACVVVGEVVSTNNLEVQLGGTWAYIHSSHFNQKYNLLANVLPICCLEINHKILVLWLHKKSKNILKKRDWSWTQVLVPVGLRRLVPMFCSSCSKNMVPGPILIIFREQNLQLGTGKLNW